MPAPKDKDKYDLYIKRLKSSHLGHISLTKNKTYEEIYGEKRAKEIKDKMSRDRKGSIPWNLNKKLTKEHIEKVKKNHSHFKYWLGKKRPEITGENNYRWVDGKIYNRETKRNDWKNIVKHVLERDKYKCQNCSRYFIDLDVHHIIPYRVSRNDGLDNLITLCRSCHMKVEWEYIKNEDRMKDERIEVV